MPNLRRTDKLLGSSDIVTTVKAPVNRDAVFPVAEAGGMVTITTPASGSTFTPFASQVCRRVVISNTSGDILEVQQDAAGAVFAIPDGTAPEFYVSNMSQLAVRKKTAGAVAVSARWEM